MQTVRCGGSRDVITVKLGKRKGGREYADFGGGQRSVASKLPRKPNPHPKPPGTENGHDHY